MATMKWIDRADWRRRKRRATTATRHSFRGHGQPVKTISGKKMKNHRNVADLLQYIVIARFLAVGKRRTTH